MKNSELKKAGLKTTIPRIQILELLDSTDSPKHLSAEDVYKKLLSQDSDIGLATVYRVLTQFEQAGLVTRHHFDGVHSIYELNNGQHHDHMVCGDCGNVHEFYSEKIEQGQHDIAIENGFTLKHHSLYMYGTCSECNKKQL